MKSQITYGAARSEQELTEILELQKANLPKSLSQDELAKEGFVTVEHDLSVLQKMNIPYPHIIAKSNGKVVAYALIMLRELAPEIPILQPMFEQIDVTKYKNKFIGYCTYFVMGQICISKEFRGKDVFPGLYQEMKRRMQEHQFDYVLTEIDKKNERSLRAHAKVGFQTVKEYQDPSEVDWVIVLWDFE